MSPHSARDKCCGLCLLGDGGCCCVVLAIHLCKLRSTRNLGVFLPNLGARRVTWQFRIDDPGFLSDLSRVHTNVRNVHQFLGCLPMFQVSTISWVHTNVRNVHQFLGCLPMFQVSTISWVHTNVRNAQHFLGYIRMFETPNTFLGTYECSKRPPVSWVLTNFRMSTICRVHTNVRNVHQFLEYLRMSELSNFLGTY